ncbi:MAG: hypothetical protein ACKO2G_11335 [Verrucomicrobiales bacterium]
MDAEGVRRWLGAVPPLVPGFNDLTHELSTRDGKRFAKARERLRDRHAQCDFHWIHTRVAPEVPHRVQAFHFFNHGQLCSPACSGGSNRDALLVTDPTGPSATLIVGYGIEPFLLPGELEQSLEAGQAALQIVDFGGAAATIVRIWENVLGRVLERLPRTFGLPSADEMQVRLDESVRAATLRRPSEY